MMSDMDIVRAAGAMMNEFGAHAEFQAARYADLMLGYSNRASRNKLNLLDQINSGDPTIFPATRVLTHSASPYKAKSARPVRDRAPSL